MAVRNEERMRPVYDIRPSMRILMLAAASSVHTVRWANAFAERGTTVHLCTQHDPLPSLGPGIVVHRLPHAGGLGYMLNSAKVNKLVRDVGADIVNAHYATGYGSLAYGITAAPVVLNVWGSDVFVFPDRSPLHKWLLVRNLGKAQRLVSTSEAMAQRTRKIMGGTADIDVVPFGVDVERFKPRPRRDRTEITIGTVKTLKPVYGVDRLIAAFATLRTMRPDLNMKLRIVGEGPERSVLEQQAAHADIGDRVEFAGAVPHHLVPVELGKLDVYLALSRSESFGVAVIEASACGLPVVVSDAGGLPEVVPHGVTGFVIPDGDPGTAAEHLVRLVDDADLRDRMGRAGAQWVKDRYSWPHCVDLQLAVLQQAIDQR